MFQICLPNEGLEVFMGQNIEIVWGKWWEPGESEGIDGLSMRNQTLWLFIEKYTE